MPGSRALGELQALLIDGHQLIPSPLSLIDRGHGAHREEDANVADALHEIAATQAAHREAEEVERAERADFERGEVLQSRTHGQEGALQALAREQNGGAE